MGCLNDINMTDAQYDASFVEEIQARWYYDMCIDASKMPRLLEIAAKCRNVRRVEEEIEWLRKKIG